MMTISTSVRSGLRRIAHAAPASSSAAANTAITSGHLRMPFHAAIGKNDAIARYATIAVRACLRHHRHPLRATRRPAVAADPSAALAPATRSAPPHLRARDRGRGRAPPSASPPHGHPSRARPVRDRVAPSPRSCDERGRGLRRDSEYASSGVAGGSNAKSTAGSTGAVSARPGPTTVYGSSPSVPGIPSSYGNPRVLRRVVPDDDHRVIARA